MQFTRDDLDWAVDRGVINASTRDDLASALEEKYKDTPSLTIANVLYYLGGLIVIGAMTFYVTQAWESLGGLGHLLIALLYGSFFLAVGSWLWHARGLVIPGGILVTAAVCMTPMAVFGLQEMTGQWMGEDPGVYRDFYRWIKSYWCHMEVATILAGILALRFFRFPFITMPIAVSLWFMSMDLAALAFGADYTWELRQTVSMWFGLGMLVVSFMADNRTRKDFAYWGYLFGMIAFWGGLTSLDSDSELGKFLYCCVNVVLMLISVLIRRQVFIVFGSIGVFIYLGHLAESVFKDTLMFSFGLSVIGLAVIGLGIQYHKHRTAIEDWLLAVIPEGVRRTLPQYRQPRTEVRRP